MVPPFPWELNELRTPSLIPFTEDFRAFDCREWLLLFMFELFSS
jgi:hypothetical protein